MSYSDFDAVFSTRIQSDPATSGNQLAGGAAGSSFLNADLANPLTTTGVYGRKFRHSSPNATDVSIGQTKILLSNTGSGSASQFYNASDDKTVSVRLRVRMAVAEDNASAVANPSLHTMVGVTAFTSGAAGAYSGGYELVLQATGAGAQRSVSLVLRAGTDADFASNGLASLTNRNLTTCTGTYELDTWYFIRLDVIPNSATQKTLKAYTSNNNGASWTQVGEMLVRSTDSYWSAPTNNQTGLFSLRASDVATNDIYDHFVDNFEAYIESVAANTTPTVGDGIGDQTAVEATAFTYQFPETAFADAEQITLAYTATLSDDSPLPAWLSFTSGTRTFAGTPDHGDVGVVTIKVKAQDSSGAFTTDTFNLTVTDVNQAPSLNVVPTDQTILEARTLSYQLPENTFVDPDGDTITYSAALSSGDPLPAWLSFDPNTRTFSGTPTASDAAVYTIRVTATDSNGATASVLFTIDAQEDTDAPIAPNVALLNDTGVSAVDNITSVASLSISGTEAGATLEYSSDNTNWSTTVYSPVEGSNTVYVRQVDAAGNPSSSSSLTYILIVNAPVFVSGTTATPIFSRSGAGQEVYTANATGGAATATEITYALSGTDAADFTLDSATGVVTLTGNPNADVKASYDFTITATDVAGLSTGQNVSLAITANDAPTGDVTITGEPVIGTVLTANINFTDVDGTANAVYAYQWYREGVAITGETNATYTAVTADKDKSVSVIVSYNDDAGKPETVASAAFGPIHSYAVPTVQYTFDTADYSGVTLSDASGNSNNATNYGATQGQTGKYGEAFAFDGTDYIDASSVFDVPAETAFSISVWVNLNSLVSNFGQIAGNRIFADATDATKPGWSIVVDDAVANDRVGQFVLRSSAAAYAEISFGTIPASGWQHLCVTYEPNVTSDGNGTIKTYVNKVLINSGEFAGLDSQAYNGAASLIGAAPDGAGGVTNRFAGLLDEFYFWSGSALTAAQITDLFDGV
jgi:hypothetical protein